MDIQYGLPTLGQIQLFLRKVAGDDALCEIARKKMESNEIPYKENTSLKKEWDRFCAEETKNHEKIKDYENYSLSEKPNISNLFNCFLDELKADYKIPTEISEEIYNFCEMLYGFYKQLNFFTGWNEMCQFENQKAQEYEAGKLPLVAENKTANFVSFYLRMLLMLSVAEACKRNFSKTKEFIKFYLSDDFSYKSLFDKLWQEKNCKSIDALCDTLDNKSEVNPYKSFIKKSLKDDKNPAWSKLKMILPFCSDELKKQFTAKYLLSNCEAALQEVFQISKSEIEGIKKALDDFSKSEVFSDKNIAQFFHNVATIEPAKNERDPFCGETNGKASVAVAVLCNLVFKKHIYKKPVKDNSSFDFDKLLEGLADFAPHSQAFFVPFIKAYVAVANRDFDKAMELFNTAFEFKQFAGDYLEMFLEMAFCFANYYKANWISVRKSIKKEDGVQNPVSCDVKMFKNFGYAVSIFPDSAESSYFEAYNNLDYFYKIFPIECFIDEEKARKIQKQEYENQKIKIETDGRKKQKFEDNHPYEMLFKLQGKDRNKLIPEKSLFTLNTDHNPKQKDLCPPVVLCIRYSLKDERLLGLAENWLSNAETPINTTAVSFDGSTALCEALKIYTYLKSHIYSENAEKIRKIPQESYKKIVMNNYEKSDEEYQTELNKASKKFFRILDSYKLKIARYKKLAEQLIERTDWEYELKFGERLPTLAFAIQTYDFELVKKLSEKIPEKEFDGYKVTNGFTPLVYAILQKEPVSFGVSEYIRKQRDIHIPHSIGKNRFGLTREEKVKNYEFGNSIPEGIDFTKYHMFHEEEQFSDEEAYDFFSLYGDEGTFEEQVKEYDKIIDYFINRTHDINAVVNMVSTWISPFIRSDSDKRVNISAGMLNFTTLFMAGISNDADTCRKLLKMGAKTVLPKDKAGVFLDKFGETVFFFEDNFINMLIEYKSWETLVMFLKEFPDEAKISLRNDEFEMNPFMLFAVVVQNYFIWTGRDKREWKPVVQWITDLFISCGANPDEKTKIGTARQYLERYGIKI